MNLNHLRLVSKLIIMNTVTKQVNALISAAHSVSRLKRDMRKFRLQTTTTEDEKISAIKKQRFDLETEIVNILTSAGLKFYNWTEWAKNNQYLIYRSLGDKFSDILASMRSIEHSYIKMKLKLKLKIRNRNIIGVITSTYRNAAGHAWLNVVMSTENFEENNRALGCVDHEPINGFEYGLPGKSVYATLHIVKWCQYGCVESDSD